MFNKYKNIKRQYLETKRILNQNSGKIPEVDGNPNFFENPNYNFYFDNQLILKNSNNPTFTYKLNKDFEVEVQEQQPTSVTLSLSKLVNHCVQLGESNIPLHLCYLDQKFTLLINLVKFLKTTLRKIIPILITEFKNRDFSVELIKKLSEQNELIKSRDLVESQEFEDLQELEEFTPRYDFSEIYDMFSDLSVTSTEKKENLDKCTEKLSKIDYEIKERLEKSQNPQELFKQKKEIKDLIKKLVIDTELLVEQTTDMINIFDFSKFLKDLNELFNIKNEEFFGITNKFSLLNKYSFANKTKEILDIIFSKENTTPQNILSLFPSRESYINLSDHIYYNYNYKRTLKDVSEKLKNTMKNFTQKLKNITKNLLKKVSVGEIQILGDTVTEVVQNLEEVIDNFTKDESIETFVVKIVKTLENFTVKLSEKEIYFTKELKQSVDDTQKELILTMEDFTESKTVENTKVLLKKTVEDFLSKVSEIISTKKDYNKLDNYIRDDLTKINNLKKFIYRVDQLDKIILFEKTYNIKLSIFFFATWIGYRLEKKKFNFNYKNTELGIDTHLENLLPVSRNNLINNLFFRNLKFQKYESLHKEIVSNSIPIFTYSTSNYYDDNGVKRAYPDCVETVLFNICKVLCYDFNLKTYNVELLPDTFNPDIKNIFKEYTNKVDGNQEDKNNFAACVSKMNGVKYRICTTNGNFNIISNENNVLNALYNILFWSLVESNQVEVREMEKKIKVGQLNDVFNLFVMSEIGNGVNIKIVHNEQTYHIQVLDGHSSFVNMSQEINKNIEKYFYKNLLYSFTSITTIYVNAMFPLFILNYKEILYSIYKKFMLDINEFKHKKVIYELSKISSDIKVKYRKQFSSDLRNIGYVIKIDNVKDLEKILKGYSNVRCSHELVQAIHYNSYECAKLLILSGANVNYLNFADETPLYKAIENSNISIVTLLIDKGANIEAKNFIGEVSLHLAVRVNNIDIVRLLIEKGANIEAETNNQHKTPLHYACENSNFEMLELLVEKGANIEAETSDHKTPFHYVCENSNFEIVNYLIEKGVNIAAQTYNKETSLHFACKGSNVEVVELLINKGLDINFKDIDGLTPLHYACKNGNLEIAKLLIEKSADISAETNTKKTPLHFACISRNTEIVELLIRIGVNVNSIDDNNWTPLHYACGSGIFEIVRLLINSGAVVNDDLVEYNDYINVGKYTLLHIAVKSNNFDTVKLLLEKGLDIQAKTSDNETVLHLATKTDNFNIVKLLIDNGADVEAKNDYNVTPLHLAVKSDNLDIVKLLVENGASVSVKDNDDNTPLDLAMHSTQNIFELLLSKQTDGKYTAEMYSSAQYSNWGEIEEYH